MSGCFFHTGTTKKMEPYWGPVTSSIDFCEPNYVWTPYVAEFWNACTSLFIAYAGVVSYVCAPKCIFDNRSKVLVLQLACIILVIVGFGSAVFHGTLQRGFQAWDEIPMMCGSAVSVCCIREALLSREVKHSATAALVRRERLLTLCTMATQIWLYFVRGDFRTFFAIFTAVVFYVIYLVVRILSVIQDPALNRICCRSGITLACASVSWFLSEGCCAQLGFLHLHVVWHVLSVTGICHHILFHWYILNPEEARKLKFQWQYGVPTLAVA